MEQAFPSAPARKLLLIERNDHHFTSVESIPDEYLSLLIPYAGAYFYRDEDCDMLCQHIALEHFSVWSHDIFARNDIELCPYTPFHILALHYMHEDSIIADIYETGRFRLQEKECNLFSLQAHFHSAMLPANRNICSFHINIKPDALPVLAAQYPALQHLATKELGPASGPLNQAPYRINAVCQRLLKRVLKCRYVEAQAEYYLRRCCAELYINFAVQDRLAAGPRLQPGAQDAGMLHRIYLAIAQHPHKPFAARELAVKELLTRSRLPKALLQAGFEAMFGITIPDFMHQQRMMYAYHQVARKPATLGAIALHNGFANRRALGKAFGEYFDCDPADIRNAQ